jgi:sugar phosphate isomerase/epimerase
MKFGVCGNQELARAARAAGFDFMEGTVEPLLCPREPEAAFEASLAALKASALAFTAVNVFLPGAFKITGPAVDSSVLEPYARTTFRRAARAGIRTVVLGSGGARNVPEGFDRRRARAQIVEFCRLIAPAAQEYGITVAIEPLHRQASNILNTVREAADVVREVDHPAIRLLVDSYHWAVDGDSADDIVRHGDLLRHVHVGTTAKRLAPGAEPCDFAVFFKALAEAGYQGNVSIEASLPEPPVDLPRALATMRGLEAECRR